MSECISTKGEFSEHTFLDGGTDGSEFICADCYAYDEERAEAEVKRLREALAASEAKVAKFNHILDQYTDGKISKVACVSLMLNAADS